MLGFLIISALPFITATVFALVLAFMARKDYAQRVLLLIALLSVFFSFIDVVYVAPMDFEKYIYFDLLAQFVVPVAPLAVMMYVRALYRKRVFSPASMVCLIPALVLGTGSAMIVYILGVEPVAAYLEALSEGTNIAKGEPLLLLYRTWSQIVYMSVLFVEVVIMMVTSCAHLSKTGFSLRKWASFLFKGEKIPMPHAQTMSLILYFLVLAVRISMGRPYFQAHPVFSEYVSVLLNLLLLLIGLTGLVREEEMLTLKDVILLRKVSQKPGMTAPSRSFTMREGTPVGELPARDRRYIRKQGAFNELMETQQYFLNPGISIESVAVRSGLSRSFISTMLSNTYHCTFNEYVNYHRIQHSMKLMKEYPSYSLEVIAGECGYPSLAAFSRRFKEQTGMTPGRWRKEN